MTAVGTGCGRLSVISLAALLTACASTGGLSTRTVDPVVCAQIFSTNDTHGRLLPAVQSWSEGRLVGGSATLAGFVAEARAADPDCPVFIVSGGDIMQGTLVSNLTDGRSTIAAMNLIGYDAVAIGNHEFDWGVDVLLDRIAQAEFVMLGANIYLKGTDRHPDWVRPWTVVEKEGVRVGFVGMTTRSTPTTTKPTNVVDFEFRSISEALDRYIPIVRQQDVDFVVAVMHEGAFCDADACAGEALDALGQTWMQFDYAVTGHTHSRVEAEVRGVPVVQSFSNTTAYGLGRIEREPDGAVNAKLLGIRRAYADEVMPEPGVAALVERYVSELSGEISREVTVLARPAANPRRGEFPLGRLIADAQRSAANTQVAMMNNGGIRRPLPAGPLAYADLFEVQPFGNRLVHLRVSGAVLLRAVEHAIKEDGVDSQLSGLTVRYDPAARRGSRILEARLSDGSAIDPTDRYELVVNDFMATGGGGYTMFHEADQSTETGIVDLDALVVYLESLPKPVRLPEDERWMPPRP